MLIFSKSNRSVTNEWYRNTNDISALMDFSDGIFCMAFSWNCRSWHGVKGIHASISEKPLEKIKYIYNFIAI